MVSQVSDVVIGPLILFLCDLNTKQDKYGIAFFILHVEPSVESKFIFIFHKGSVFSFTLFLKLLSSNHEWIQCILFIVSDTCIILCDIDTILTTVSRFWLHGIDQVKMEGLTCIIWWQNFLVQWIDWSKILKLIIDQTFCQWVHLNEIYRHYQIF